MKTFVCRLRMNGCNSTKAAYSTKEEDGTYKTEMREAAVLQMMGMKDDIFGPATPACSVNMTIANTAVAEMLREAYKKYYLEHKEEHPNQSTGVEIRAEFTVVGPAPMDTYP